MFDKPLLKHGSIQKEMGDGPFCLNGNPLRKGTPNMEDAISTYSRNTASSSLSLPMTPSPPASCPPTPRPSFSRSSSPAWNDNARSSPLVLSPSTVPLPDSRACSPHPPTPLGTNLSRSAHSREHSPVRSSEFHSGRWISPTARKHCSDPLLTSPLRAPPMLPAVASTTSSTSSLSKASGFSYATNAATSTAFTSIANSPVVPNVGKSFIPADVPSYHYKRPSSGSSSRASVHYKSLSDSISEACEKLCDKLKKSLRVMWRQGKRYEVDVEFEQVVAEAEGTADACAEGAASEVKVKESGLSKRWKRTSADGLRSIEKGYRQRTDSLKTNATSAATDSESLTKQPKRESAESTRNLDKTQRQRKDSSTTKQVNAGTDSESPIKQWKRKSAESIRNLDKAYRQRKDSLTSKGADTVIDSSPPLPNSKVEKSLPPVPEIADFMDLRDPFACYSSGSPQVIKNTASVIPPPSSFRYSKVIEAKKRKKRAASGSERSGSAGRPGSAGSRPGSAGSGSSVGRSRSRRVGSSAAARRLRPIIPKRVDVKLSQAPKGCVNPKLASPTRNRLVSFAPMKISKPPRPPTPNLLATTPPIHRETLGFSGSTSFGASQMLVTSSNSFSQVIVKSPSPFTPTSAKSVASQKRSSATPLFVPFSVSLPTVPMTGSSSLLPTPPLTPSSPTSPDWSPSFPSTPASTRACSPAPEIRPAKSQASPVPPRVATPPSDGRVWI